MAILTSVILMGCNERPAISVTYEWVRFSEDLACRNELTGYVQCFRIEVALRSKVKDREGSNSVDSKLPPEFRDRIRLRLERAGVIPVDFDDVAIVAGLRRDLSEALDTVVDTPRVEVDLKSCGERVEDMTDYEFEKLFDEMADESKRKVMTLPPTLGYVDDGDRHPDS